MQLHKEAKKLAICALEYLALKTDFEFVDRDGNCCMIAVDVPYKLLQDLLDAKVNFFSDSDPIGFLYPSDTPISNLLNFAEDRPHCVFNTVLTFDEHANIVKLSIIALTNYNTTHPEFAKALASVAPCNSIISIEEDGVFAYMDTPHTS